MEHQQTREQNTCCWLARIGAVVGRMQLCMGIARRTNATQSAAKLGLSFRTSPQGASNLCSYSTHLVVFRDSETSGSRRFPLVCASESRPDSRCRGVSETHCWFLVPSGTSEIKGPGNCEDVGHSCVQRRLEGQVRGSLLSWLLRIRPRKQGSGSSMVA